jgi:hypothetical protein
MVDAIICIDEAEIKRRLGVLANQSGKVIARAANRAYPTGKHAISKEASKDYLISQKDINDKNVLKITKAEPSEPVVVFFYSGQHRNLYLWNNKKAASPNKIIHWGKGRKGRKPNVKIYKAAVVRGHGKIKLMGDDNNKPFIQRVRSGENSEFVGLFQRKTSDSRSKLKSLEAPAIPQILKNTKIMAQFNNSVGPVFQKRLEHEIDVVLKGLDDWKNDGFEATGSNN